MNDAESLSKMTQHHSLDSLRTRRAVPGQDKTTHQINSPKEATMNAWILLLIAGLLETGWAVGLKYTNGFTQLWPSLWTAIALVLSMFLLALAVRVLPIGTAYPIWVGIGATGAALFGMVYLGESASPVRIFFLLLLVASIIGLKATSGNHDAQPEAVSEPIILPANAEH